MRDDEGGDTLGDGRAALLVYTRALRSHDRAHHHVKQLLLAQFGDVGGDECLEEL